MVKYIKLSLALVGSIALFLTLSALTANSQDGARISFVDGSPKINKVNTASWVGCKVDMAVDTGDRIRTSKGEVVEISFLGSGSNVIKVSEDSDVFIKKCETPYTIELLNGEVMALLKKLPPGSTFEVRTPAGISGARGTGWSNRTDGKKSEFGAFEGSIFTKGIDASGNPMEGELIVKSGFKTVVDMFEKPGKLEALSERELERWNEWKESLSDRSLVSADRSQLERADSMVGETGDLESKKSDMSETRDTERIEARTETKSEESSQESSHTTYTP